MAKFQLKLPSIPTPPPNAPGFSVAEGFQGTSLLKSFGDTDLLCGRCEAVLAESMEPHQLKNLVLQCPKCRTYSAVSDIPRLELFVSHLQAAGFAVDQIPKFQQVRRPPASE